jgi:hypothetical protein
MILTWLALVVYLTGGSVSVLGTRKRHSEWSLIQMLVAALAWPYLVVRRCFGPWRRNKPSQW